ncbi:MAG: DNA polymerase I [Actinobacteria bacterium]|nr:DNA polymerase I [Actinomycetota bacterium]
MTTLMLIDGNSLTYRAFFALPTDMATASGQVTNAVFGFTSMLVNLLRDQKPDHLAVVFDRSEPTFRHEALSTYKGNRDATPDLLRQQMGIVREVVETLRVPVLDLVGFEADDIIATLATAAEARGDNVIIVTGDRDSYQLVHDPHIKVLYNKRGVSDYALYDEAGIFERTGVKPTDYVHYAALRGDPSDNLPGVPGVGEKTAAKLINQYGGIDGIYEHLDELTPKLRQNLAENEDKARMNIDLMTLRHDAPVTVDPDELQIGNFDLAEVRQLFDFLEFRQLFDRLIGVLGVANDSTEAASSSVLEAERTDVSTQKDAIALFAELAKSDGPLAAAGAWEGDEGRSVFEGIAIVTDASMGEVAWVGAETLAAPKVAAAAGAVFADGGRAVVAHDAKALMRGLDTCGIDLRSLALDTMIAAYLLDPAEPRYSLEPLLDRYADARLPQDDDQGEGQLDFGGADTSALAQRASRRALGVNALVVPLQESLVARALADLNADIEVPLVRVLARMEILGVGVDEGELRKLRDQLVARCDELRLLIWADAGEEFNVNSTVKLREILFEKLELTPQKKTKTGYSTDAATLEKLLGEHPIIEHLLAYREVEKLRSTYGEGLLTEIAADGRIHATFNQTVARTGRLSSDAPNLHNIPVRSELGREFRKAFVPAKGYTLLIADYNQIELRCIAHLAEDPGLIGAFESGQDIHNATAARVFGVDPTTVTIEQRSKAKMVSYGLAYGMEAFGLAQRLGVPISEAQQILDAYFVAFPAVHDYMERTIAEAREKGYTETLFGRRRQIPELASDNFRIRQAGERQAMNAGIQGLAADIFKVALIRLDRALDAGGSTSRLILQVHDEVICEVPPADLDAVTAVVLEAMSGAFDLRVPLEVNLSHGDSWAAAKG